MDVNGARHTRAHRYLNSHRVMGYVARIRRESTELHACIGFLRKKNTEMPVFYSKCCFVYIVFLIPKVKEANIHLKPHNN